MLNLSLLTACRTGDVKKCKTLITKGADVNSYEHLVAPLSIACTQAYPACVHVLLRNGANVNFVPSTRMTHLLEVVLESSPPDGVELDKFVNRICKCIKYLVEYNVDINSTSDVSMGTALKYATWNLQITETLLIAGADANIMDIDHTSPLHFAISQHHFDVVEYLLKFGANVDSLDNNGLTALQLALSRPIISPNRVAVMQQMFYKYAQMRLEESSAEWIRLARNEHDRPQMDDVHVPMTTSKRQRRMYLSCLDILKLFFVFYKYTYMYIIKCFVIFGLNFFRSFWLPV